MTTIYLICSAEAEEDLYRIVHGSYNSNLTARGKRQIKALEKCFTDIPIDRTYTSSLYHACVTASAICKPRNLPIQRRNDLQEICLGIWEGKSWGNIAYEMPKQLGYFNTALDKWFVEDAETPQQVAERMLNAIQQISKENDGKAVAVVSHRFAIRFLLAKLLDIPLEETHNLPLGEPTAVSTIEADGDIFYLTAQNDVSHLQDAEYQSCEKPYTTPDFNADMYFHQLRWIECGEVMAEAVECVWQEAGEDRLFDKNTLLQNATMMTTLVGYAEHEPVGFLQLGMEPGWIMLLCTHPGGRKAGLGTQLIGQAVMAARSRGGNYLRIALPEKNPYRQFFLNHGFVSAGRTREGREVFEKDIRFDPKFLSE